MTDPRMTPTNDAPVTVEPENCPFCGSDEVSHGSGYPGYADGKHGIVQCHSCDAIMLGDEEDDAIRQWNTRLAALASAPAGDGVEVERWRERWYGSEPQKGSAITNERGNLIAYFGGDEATHAAVTKIVSAHNAALARPRAAVGEQSREAIEAECAALIATYYRREIDTLMQQAEHWAENGKPLAVHHRVMKADDYFQIVCQMERDPAKGWKLPFDEIRDALGRKPIKGPGTYPPSKDLYRYRDPAFVVAALQSPPAKVEE